MPNLAPERLLVDLNEAQREAVTITSGPLVVLAGAGTGKTRVISRRAAFAVETGAVAPDRILLVTFTDKAANEMVARMAALGHRGVTARTFHAHALSQLRFFWPSRHDGAQLPGVLESKARLLVPLAGRLPGGYRFTPVADLADAIEWAKVRRITPGRWLAEGGERSPVPPDVFARLYADYERAKARGGVLDFEDMLARTVDLLESDEEALRLVRSRKTWFSVDEYQDTNPLQERLLELWLGESRDLAVVGDPDQTIYTFTGATPEFLIRFADRHPGARTVSLTENYRSTPELLALANRLVTGRPGRALTATRPSGPPPTIRRFPDAEAELDALVARIQGLHSGGLRWSEMSVLVRVNAQLPPIEEELTRAAIPYTLRGRPFWQRREVRDAVTLLRRANPSERGADLVAAVRSLFVERLGLGSGGDGTGAESRERDASLELILTIATHLLERDPAVDLVAILAELDRRVAAERENAAHGVNLLTYHRAKGLEWDAVFLPVLEEGTMPIRHAQTDESIAEERRLLYVGITRTRIHLALSWAALRAGPGGRDAARRPSRFLDELEPTRTRSARPRATRILPPHDGLLEALRHWRRERARADAVPAYVVATDATLLAIAEARPASLAALRRVKGMGPVRLEQYGAEILALTVPATTTRG